ncbi:MAG: bifunctional ADP-heptose synthase [Saprospiraceae bacterium]|jgi:rfaE bifunctional protein kinase chain/domain
MKNEESIILPDFGDLHILVIGDVMIDRYISGTVSRISPEAPVPVVNMKSVENRLGGAANVALNLHALGAQVSLLSVIGQDEDGADLISKIEKTIGLHQHLVQLPSKITTVKTRIMAGNQHLLRIDQEDAQDIINEDSEIIYQRYLEIIKYGIDGIILQDYNKGLLVPELIHRIIKKANDEGIPTFVDPKEKNFFEFTSCTLFKPNKKEMSAAVATNDVKIGIAKIRQKMNHKISVVTLGGEGMYIQDDQNGEIYPTSQRIISDVCGAGDTVISTLCVTYLKGLSLGQMAKIANRAGGLVCEKPGVVSVDLKDLQAELI